MQRYFPLFEYTKSKIIPISSSNNLTNEELKYWNNDLLPRFKTSQIKYDYLTAEDKKKIDELLIAFKKNFHKIMGSIDENHKQDPKKRLSLLNIKNMRIFQASGTYIIGFAINEYLYFFSTKEDYNKMKHENYGHQDLGEYGVWFA